MRRAVVTLLLALPLVVGNATTALGDATIKPDDGTITASLLNYRENDLFKLQLKLPPSSGVIITVTDVPSSFSFIVLQIHTYQYNATLSYDKTLLDRVSKRSLFGSNIGLYLKTHNATGPMQVFLKHNNVHDLDALLVIVPYGPNAPIPGGCNMEFEIEIAPYQKLRVENKMIVVDAQPAAAPAVNDSPISCEKDPVRHTMYRLHLPMYDFAPKTYFDTIASMLTVRDIVRNGIEIPFAPTISSMRRIYSMYAGTGFVYAVVATYGNYSSAYVPTFSYGCSPLLYPNSCDVLSDAFSKVVCAIVLFIGILSVFIGHKPQYAAADRLLSDCAMGGFVGYTIAVSAGDLGTAIDVLIGVSLAIITVCVMPCIRLLRNSVFALFTHLPLGFLCGCVTYLYAPAAMSYVLGYEWSFWLIFVSLMLTVTVFIKTFYIAEIITRAVFGSYFLIIAVDYYVGTNLKYIMITMIRRITVSDFRFAYVYPPVQTQDLTIIGIWIILIILRFIRIIRARVSELSTNDERQDLLEANGIIVTRTWYQSIG